MNGNGEPFPNSDARLRFVLGAAFAAFVAVLLAPALLRDGDTGWHLAAGAWILEHGRVPATDPFSFSAVGRPWVAHEWLAELGMHAAFSAGGWTGLTLLFALAFAVLYGMVAAYVTRWLSVPASIVALLLVAIGIAPLLLARPHLLALPLLALWTVVLLDARDADRSPPLAWATLMLAWANLHGSFVLGLGIAAIVALEALVEARSERRLKVIVGWGGFGVASLVAALLTPYGVHGLLFPLYVGRLHLLAGLTEWQAADFSSISGTEVVLMVGLAALLVRPARVPLLRLLLLLALTHMALEHVRQTMVLAIVGVLVLAEPLGRARGRTARAAPLARSGFRTLPWPTLALFAAAIVLRIVVPVARGDDATVPESALHHIPASLRDRPVFNEYSFGGALILAGVRPYIDGRSDMYGDPFTLDYYRVLRGDPDRWRAAEARWRFGWTILSPSNGLVSRLDADPRWQRLYADRVAIVHVRR